MTPAPVSPPGIPPTPVSPLALFAAKLFSAIWFTHSKSGETASISKVLARQQPLTERFVLWCHDVLSTSTRSFADFPFNRITHSKFVSRSGRHSFRRHSRAPLCASSQKPQRDQREQGIGVRSRSNRTHARERFPRRSHLHRQDLGGGCFSLPVASHCLRTGIPRWTRFPARSGRRRILGVRSGDRRSARRAGRDAKAKAERSFARSPKRATPPFEFPSFLRRSASPP